MLEKLVTFNDVSNYTKTKIIFSCYVETDKVIQTYSDEWPHMSRCYFISSRIKLSLLYYYTCQYLKPFAFEAFSFLLLKFSLDRLEGIQNSYLLPSSNV